MIASGAYFSITSGRRIMSNSDITSFPVTVRIADSSSGYWDRKMDTMVSSYDPLSNLNIITFSERRPSQSSVINNVGFILSSNMCLAHVTPVTRLKITYSRRKKIVQSFVDANISRNLSYCAQVSNRLWIRCQDIKVFIDFHIFQAAANHWSDNCIIEGLCDTLGRVTRSFAFSVKVSTSWSSQLTYLCSDSPWNVFSCTAGSSCHELDSWARLTAGSIHLSKSLTTVEDLRSHS